MISLVLLYFNSIKVQLELDDAHHALLLTVFQFHKGTIRTFYDFDNDFIDKNFNSIKVQLELIKII